MTRSIFYFPFGNLTNNQYEQHAIQRKITRSPLACTEACTQWWMAMTLTCYLRDLLRLLPFFSFNSFHDRAESSEVTSGGTWIHCLPRLWALWFKETFLSTNNCFFGIDIWVTSSQTWLGNRSGIVFRWNCQKLTGNDVYANYFLKTHSDNFLCLMVI